jgi:hypothetical protein
MLERQSDHDLMDRAKKAGVGEEHESSDEEVKVRWNANLYYITFVWATTIVFRIRGIFYSLF